MLSFERSHLVFFFFCRINMESTILSLAACEVQKCYSCLLAKQNSITQIHRQPFTVYGSSVINNGSVDNLKADAQMFITKEARVAYKIITDYVAN